MEQRLRSLTRKQLLNCCLEHEGYKRRFVIQYHDAKRAGPHWDLRFEASGALSLYQEMRESGEEPKGDSQSTKVLRSFAVPKAGKFKRMPRMGERWLAISTEDHPWEYQHFEGRISKGYGKGDVKLIFNGIVTTPEFTPRKIKFEYKGKHYQLFKTSYGRKNFLLIQYNPR